MWPLMWSVPVQKTLFFISAALFVFLSSSWSSARHLVSFILMLSRSSADNWSFYKNPHLHLHTNRITMSTIKILISWFELNLCVFTYSWLQSGINECFFCVFLLKYCSVSCKQTRSCDVFQQSVSCEVTADQSERSQPQIVTASRFLCVLAAATWTTWDAQTIVSPSPDFSPASWIKSCCVLITEWTSLVDWRFGLQQVCCAGCLPAWLCWLNSSDSLVVPQGSCDF